MESERVMERADGNRAAMGLRARCWRYRPNAAEQIAQIGFGRNLVDRAKDNGCALDI